MNYKQDLFHFNLPTSILDKSGKAVEPIHLGFLKKDFSPWVFKRHNGPFIVYTGNGNIPFKERYTITDQARDDLNRLGLDIFVYEPMCFYTKTKQHNRCYYTEFRSSEDSSQYYCNELDSIQEFCQNNNLTNVVARIPDYDGYNKISKNYNAFEIILDDIFLKTVRKNIKIPHKKKFTKKFWCGIGRYTQPRHIVMSYLADLDGDYGWYFKCMDDALKDKTWITPDQFNNDRRLKIYNNNNILNRNNFYLEKDYKKIDVIDPSDGPIPNFQISQDFFASYLNCFVAVVNETRFAQPFAYISEKTLDPMIMHRPFIISGPPKSLEYTRSLGFKTFSGFWDESYDLEWDHGKRLNKIFDVIDYINNLSLKECRRIFKAMGPILKHNHKMLSKLRFK